MTDWERGGIFSLGFLFKIMCMAPSLNIHPHPTLPIPVVNVQQPLGEGRVKGIPFLFLLISNFYNLQCFQYGLFQATAVETWNSL